MADGPLYQDVQEEEGQGLEEGREECSEAEEGGPPPLEQCSKNCSIGELWLPYHMGREDDS